MAGVDVLSWFSEEELLPCPECAQRAAIADERGRLLLCLDCGEPLFLLERARG